MASRVITDLKDASQFLELAIKKGLVQWYNDRSDK
jgi:hypothetical protein